MKTILVDDEIWAIQEFGDYCKKAADIDLLGLFTDPVEALDFARETPIELAFLDIEMPGMKGTELAKELREIYPDLIIVFVSAYDRYMPEAFGMQADYFLTKPYTRQDMSDVIARAKLLSARLSKRIFIKTFGRFEVFIDGVLLSNNASKSIELLAFAVDKQGALASAHEAFLALWADKPYNNYTGAAYRKALARLLALLEEHGCKNLLNRMNGGIAVDPKVFDCDYYRFMDGDPAAREQFRGEYMTQYEWAKDTEDHLKSLM